MFYATHNSYADRNNGSFGFLNSWEVSRFPTRGERDAFVARFENKLARPITRASAGYIWRRNYLCVGAPVPRGGLFPRDDIEPERDRFFNEADYAELLR